MRGKRLGETLGVTPIQPFREAMTGFSEPDLYCGKAAA